MSTSVVDVPAPAPAGLSRLWRRELEHYPSLGARRRYLGLTVISTIVLYYMAYIQGGVATSLIAAFHLTFKQLVLLGVLGNGVGALASLAAGLSDRFGRANMTVGGMLISSLLVAFAIPNASSKTEFFVLVTLLGLVEGAVLVATPALIRDFSPQVGRGQAMGFWTLGPVLGSLLVTVISSHVLPSHPNWQFSFRLAGFCGLAVTALALVMLRELSPALRDQVMGSERERVLVEARAKGLDLDALAHGHWRQMFRLDVLGPALAISIFLLLYYALVGFLVVYFATTFGYSEARTNSLGNWYWASNAVALVIGGVMTDKLRVRKPFMVGGLLLGLVGNVMFALSATRPETSYRAFTVYFMLSAVGGGIAYVAWMAAFTETVEKHNPAATATGLALWGWTLRSVVSVSLIALTFVVPATSTLVEHGPRVQQIAATYPAQVATLGKVPGDVLKALSLDPGDVENSATAVAALTGLDRGPLRDALQYNADHADVIATGQALSPDVVTRLADKSDSAAVDLAVAQISTKLGISKAAAGNRLLALAAAPKAQLDYLTAHVAQLTAASDQLKALSTIPAADLAYLGEHATDVVQAQKDNGRQWQHWWWVCIAGQLLFLPFVFLLTGRWSPRRAKQDAADHEAQIDAQLQELLAELPTPRTATEQVQASGARTSG
ncbi:MAG: transporter [Frankiales bacterium]|nr:transporter [Frankiales bacterium]